MANKSLDTILSTFEPTQQNAESELKDGKPVTIWLPREHHKAYGELQKSSRGKFCKKLREIILASIDHAKSKAA